MFRKTMKSVTKMPHVIVVLIFLVCMAGCLSTRHTWHEIKSVQPEQVAYIVFGKEIDDEEPLDSNSKEHEVKELFRVTDANTIRDLVLAVQHTGEQPNEGAAFAGYLPNQYYVGTNGVVLFDVIVFIDRNVWPHRSSCIRSGKIYSGLPDEWKGPTAPNTQYTRLIYSLLLQHTPDEIKMWNEIYRENGGLPVLLGISAK
ncbi:MAG: hypothetical protein WCP86_11675 [bacterium]